MQKFPSRMWSHFTFYSEDFRKPWRTQRAELFFRGSFTYWQFVSKAQKTLQFGEKCLHFFFVFLGVLIKKRQGWGWSWFCSSLSPASPFTTERVSQQYFHIKLLLSTLGDRCRRRLNVEGVLTGWNGSKCNYLTSWQVLSSQAVSDPNCGLRAISGPLIEIKN